MEFFGEASYSADKLLSWQRSVKSTQYGAGGLTKAVLDGDRVKFLNTITGALFDTIDEAFDEIGKINATNFARLEFDSFGKNISTGNIRGTGGLSQFLLDLQKQTAGIVDAPERLFLEVGNIKRGDNLTKAQSGFLEKSIIVPEDEGFNFLRLGYRDQTGKIINYTTQEMNQIFSQVGAGLVSPNKLIKALAEGDAGLMGIFEKLGKRVKGAIALRGESISGQLLTDLLGGTDLEQSTLIVDTQDDLRKVLAGFLEDSTKTEQELFKEISREARAFYGVKDQPTGQISSAFQLVKDVTDRLFTDAMPSQEKQTIMNALRRGSKDGLNEKQIGIYDEVMKSLERPFDGNFVINQKFVNSYLGKIENELASLKDKQAKGILTQAEAEKLEQLLSTRRMLQNNLEDVTGRIFFIKDGQHSLLKGAADSMELEEILDKYMFVTAKAAVKNEAAIMGTTETVNLVLHGDPKGLFYADPLAPAFHSGVFTHPTVLQRLQEKRIKAIAEARQAIVNNEISPKLMNSIIRESERAVEDLPSSMQQSAYRARQYAQELRQIIEQGHDFRSFPELANYLHKFMQSTMYREKDEMFQPVMDDVYRFSVRTELGISKKMLDSAYTEVGLQKDSQVATRLMNFRIEGHRMFMAGDAANVFHNSLGGFDFDDKGVPIMRVFRDKEGRKRLTHFIMRQPTGPEEFVLGQAKLNDIETLQALFGADEDLLKGLTAVHDSSKYGADISNAAMQIKDALSPYSMQSEAMRRSAMPTIKGELKDIELALITAMEESGTTVPELDQGVLRLLKHQSYGSTLALSDLTDYAQAESIGLERQYVRGKIFQTTTRPDPNKLSEYVDPELGKSIKSIIGEADYDILSKKAGGLLPALGEVMGGLDKQVSDQILAAVSDYYNRLALSNTVGSLGQYINRLTFAASMTNQLEDALESLPEAVRNSINQKYAIGFVKPESAVDYTVNLSGKKVVIGAKTAQEAGEALTQMALGGASEQAIIDAAMRLYGETGVYENPLDYIGKMGIIDSGKLFGRVRAETMIEAGRNLNFNTDLHLGIDEIVLRQRLRSGSDISSFVDNFTNEMLSYANGSEDVVNFATRVRKDILSSELSNEQKLNKLVEFIGLKADHAYASVAKLAQEGLERKEGLDAVFGIAARKRNVPFASEITMDPKANKSAQAIINFYDQEITKINRFFGTNVAEMANANIANRRQAMQELGSRIEKMIFESAKVNSIKAGDIIDNIENLASYGSRKGFRMSRLYSADEDENFLIKLFENARSQRALRFYQKNQRTNERSKRVYVNSRTTCKSR